jgi:hypothetical protein
MSRKMLQMSEPNIIRTRDFCPETLLVGPNKFIMVKSSYRRKGSK